MNYNSDVENLSVDRSRYINPKVLLEYIDDIKDKMIEAVTNYESEIQDLEKQNEELKTENSDLKDKVEELQEEVNESQVRIEMLCDQLESYDDLDLS